MNAECFLVINTIIECFSFIQAKLRRERRPNGVQQAVTLIGLDLQSRNAIKMRSVEAEDDYDYCKRTT